MSIAPPLRLPTPLHPPQTSSLRAPLVLRTSPAVVKPFRRFVSYSDQGEFMSREAFLASNFEWYKPFGYNPFEVSDARLAYAAPRFTKRDWLLFCSMALTAGPDMERVIFSRIFAGPSLPHLACSAFSEAAYGKRFGSLLPCSEFTRAFPANEFPFALQGREEEYVRACAEFEEGGVAPPKNIWDPFAINDMVRSYVSSHTSHVTRHTSHVTRHTSHVTRNYTSCITRERLHITIHDSQDMMHFMRRPSHLNRSFNTFTTFCFCGGSACRACTTLPSTRRAATCSAWTSSLKRFSGTCAILT